MKTTILTLLIVTMYSTRLLAQYKGEHDVTFPYAESKNNFGMVTEIKEAPKFVGRVQGLVGSNYSSNELSQLPTRNINKISAMTLGVQSNNGRDLIIKGVEGGTAYFVDGIRIRSGSLSLAGYNY